MSHARSGGRRSIHHDPRVSPFFLADKIKAPLLLHYASLDTRVNEGWPAFEEALKANHATYTAHFYEGANHGFHNDTTPRYDEKSATLAWQRTLAHFNKHLVEGVEVHPATSGG